VRLACFLWCLLAVWVADGRAQIFLTGGVLYESNSTGSNVNGDWEYDTFSGTANFKFTINGSSNIAIALSPGVNSLTLADGGAVSYAGVGLYFSTGGTPFGGPFGAAPNLVIVDQVTSGTTFSFATGGSAVATYGQSSGDASYSGSTTYQLGGYNVTVTAFDYGAAGTNLQLAVSAIPEPGTTALFGGLAVLGVARAWRPFAGFFAGRRKGKAFRSADV
jgi:hypothetical protein